MRSVVLAALVIGVGNVASRFLGLAREGVMAWLFGATGATDAFVVASAVPQMVYDLLIGGAISAALVPVLVDAAEDEQALGRLVSAILTLALLLLGTVAVVLGLFAPAVVGLLAPGFGDAGREQAVAMVRVMLGAVVLQGVAGVLMAVLYARRRFGLPAFAASAYNGGVILGALLLHGVFGVYALVFGVLLGAVGQVALQLPALSGLLVRPTLGLGRPEVRAIMRLYAPVALGMLVTIVGIVIDRNLASRLAEGSLSVMNYATRLIQFPLGLVGTAVSFAVLPTLARHASRAAGGPGAPGESAAADGRDGYRDTLRFGVRVVLLLMVPATVGLVMLREPLVRLLFERGRFGELETARTALVFLAYAPQLPFTALDQLLIVAFYARKDTRTPVLVGVGGVLLYLVTALALIGPLDVAGLALANAVQNSAHGLVLLALLERSGVRLLDRELGRFGFKVAVAALGMGLVLWPLAALASPAGDIGRPEGIVLVAQLGLAVLLAGAAYVGLLEALGVRDARAVWAAVRDRVRPTARADGERPGE